MLEIENKFLAIQSKLKVSIKIFIFLNFTNFSTVFCQSQIFFPKRHKFIEISGFFFQILGSSKPN